MQKMDAKTRPAAPVAEALDDLGMGALRLLAALFESQSITRAGDTLGMSQPAASRAVARLRRALADPLLVRTSRGYVLTPRAEALRQPVEAALTAIGAVFAPQGFDPALTARVFRLASTDYGSTVVVTQAAQHFLAAAPHAQLDVMPWTGDTLELLERGELDVALYADSMLPQDFHARDLFIDHYVCMMRKGHPLARLLSATKPDARKSEAMLAQIAAQPQVLLLYPDGHKMSADNILAALGHAPRHVGLRIPYFMTAPWVVANSDMVMCLPARIAVKLSGLSAVQIFPLPAKPQTFGYRIIWHERSQRDPALVWFRQLVVESSKAVS